MNKPMIKNPSSEMKAFAFRLKPKEDLKKSIIAFAGENKIKAGSIVTCVGSLEQFHLRFANQQKGTLKNGFFEIVSLAGTFSNSSCHLHLAVSDSSGNLVGGHLLEDSLIYTTAELVVVELLELEFKREPDSTYGYQELVINQRDLK